MKASMTLKGGFFGLIIASTSFFSSCDKTIAGENSMTKEADVDKKSSVNAATVTHAVIDLDLADHPFPQFISCANNGLGEWADSYGIVQQLSSVTINGNHFTAKFKWTPKGVKCIGRETGGVYNGVGVTEWNETGSLVNGSHTSGYINQFFLIGTGHAVNYKLSQLMKITIDADGTVVSTIDKTTITCE